MNFMEKGNNNKKRSDDDCYYGEEDRNHSEMTMTTTTTTTSSSTSPHRGEDGAALVPPSSSNVVIRDFIRGTFAQQPPLDLMDIASPPPSSNVVIREREHMFDKVVTPSDVGKLNRLVIPKQHAEKYFPLDSSTQDKGLLLNFEDVSTSKLWRFRYSYWNSSQSYVMTKGWSRFVKDKKLDPGDIVSFHRDRHKIDHLFIDCTHRPPPPTPPQLQHHHLLPFPSSRYFPPANNNNSFRHMGYWSTNGPPGGLFLPAHAATPFRGGGGDRQRERENYYHDPITSHNPNYRNTTGYNNNNNYYGNSNYSRYNNSPSGNSINDYYRHIHQQQQQQEGSSSSGMMRYSSLAGGSEIGISELGEQEVLLHSVPVLVQSAAATSVNNKRLRLFGVNMDCPINDNVNEDNNIDNNYNNAAATLVLMPPPSHPHLLQLRLNNDNNNDNNDN